MLKKTIHKRKTPNFFVVPLKGGYPWGYPLDTHDEEQKSEIKMKMKMKMKFIQMLWVMGNEQLPYSTELQPTIHGRPIDK